MSTTPMTVRGYVWITGILMVLLVLTVVAARVPLGALSLVVALLIASVKAALVGLYFMHLRFTTPLTRLFAVAGLLWLAIAFVLTFSDYLTRAAPLIGGVD